MQSKILSQAAEHTIALVFDAGEDPMDELTRFARDCRLDASRFTAIGGFNSAVLGYFEPSKKSYIEILVQEQVEVLTLVGDITLDGDHPRVHAHVVLGKRDASTCGGHLLKGRVNPTLELILTESPTHLKRALDRRSGLPLIKLD